MFFRCNSLTSVNLSNISPYYSLPVVFRSCPNLTYIDISSFDGYKDINMFDDLPPKGTIVIKSSFYNLIKEIIPQGWSVEIADENK